MARPRRLEKDVGRPAHRTRELENSAPVERELEDSAPASGRGESEKVAPASSGRHSLRVRALVFRRFPEIAPFGVTVDACPLGGETFGSYRDRTLNALGFTTVDLNDDTEVAGPALVIADDVWVTRRALRGFVAAAKTHAGPTRLSLPPSKMLTLTAPLQDLDTAASGRSAFSVAFVPEGASARPSALFALGEEAWVDPPYREVALGAPMPRYILGRADSEMQLPLTSTIAMHIRHWVHLLRASHLAPGVFLIETATAHPFRSAWFALRSLRFSRPRFLDALRRHAVYRGKGVRIHPTAVVEASVLGDNVVVGPHASVIGSVVGAGSFIEDRAHVNVSTLGPHTMVSRNSSMSATVTFGNTDACANGIQACVVGPRVGLTSFARPLDIVPGGEVTVIDNGKKRSVGTLPCGVAFGPDSFVGAGVMIAAGREIPAGTHVLQDPRMLLSRIDGAAAHKTVRVIDGRAVVVDDEQ